MTSEQLDPRTANVGFSHEDLGGCSSRVYYWFDPEGKLPAIRDDDFRRQHPEIADPEWERLFYEAFDRGEAEFMRDLQRMHPGMFETPEGRMAAALGRMFGPKRPTPTLADE